MNTLAEKIANLAQSQIDKITTDLLTATTTTFRLGDQNVVQRKTTLGIIYRMVASQTYWAQILESAGVAATMKLDDSETATLILANIVVMMEDYSFVHSTESTSQAVKAVSIQVIRGLKDCGVNFADLDDVHDKLQDIVDLYGITRKLLN